MLISSSTIPSGTALETDVCIIGAGPAALTLADQLASAPLRIMVLERGGRSGRPLGVQTGVVDAVDSDFGAPPSLPPRLGGGANEWIVRMPWMARGVRMVPLNPSDLASRPWVPHSGWPLAWDVLAAYYQRAQGFLGLSPFGYSADDWAEPDTPVLDLCALGWTTRMEQFASPKLFTVELIQRLKRARNVCVITDAAAGELRSVGSSVADLAVDSGGRSRLRVTARQYVLAAGGLENPRLLLSANGGNSLGAAPDLVGRYYMDHIRLRTGELVPADHRSFARMGLYDLRQRRHRAVAMGKLGLTQAAMAEHHLLNAAAMLLPKPPTEVRGALRRPNGWSRSPAVRMEEGRRFVSYVVRTGIPMAMAQRRWPPHVDGGWSSMRFRDGRFATFEVEHQIELSPDPENRLVLSERRDEVGRRRCDVRWRWTALDRTSVLATQRLFVDAVRASGFGDVVDVEEFEITTPSGSFHPSGTTRMSADGRDGVVDTDGRVHGMTNLFVAGSSTFPTVGYANPTLTIVALAIRLADHLRRISR